MIIMLVVFPLATSSIPLRHLVVDPEGSIDDINPTHAAIPSPVVQTVRPNAGVKPPIDPWLDRAVSGHPWVPPK